MDRRFIVRHLPMLPRAVVMIMAVLTCGCAQVLGIEDLPPLPIDAGPNDFAVRGTATGLLGPVDLELHLGGAAEPLRVTEEGPFAFETRLKSGASYTVVLADPDVPCTLINPTGMISNAEPRIELECTGPSLASVLVSGVEPPTITLAEGITTYEAELPLLQQSVALVATVATAGDTLTIAGTPVASGAPSPSITLSLGDNPVDIVVENDRGWRRTYRLTLRRATGLAQYAYGKASNTDPDDGFGYSVALSGDTLAVGAYQEDSAAIGVGGNQDNGATNSGAVYVFRRTGTAWQQQAYLKASNTEAGDYFGVRVALSGDTLAVGAWLEDSAATGVVGGSQGDNSASNSGAVYVFRRTGTTWQQEAYVKASNTDADDRFGYSVALSGDTLAVGAWGEDSAAKGVDGSQPDNSALDSGAVYVFRRTGTAWQQEAYLKASNTDADDRFGYSVALSGDTLAAGAAGEASAATGVDGNQDDNSDAYSGAVYVFRRTGTAWQQEAYLKASNTDANDLFGTSVALSGDSLAVGAEHEDSAATGVGGSHADNSALDSGAVYVFRRTGTAWQQEAYLKASNTDANDLFGTSVALSGDILAVGAWLEDGAAKGVGGSQTDNSAVDSGAVYVFRRTGTAWQQEGYLKASNTGAYDLFGYSVALSGDTLAVGASQEDSAALGVGGDQDDNSARNSGAVYVFH